MIKLLFIIMFLPLYLAFKLLWWVFMFFSIIVGMIFGAGK